MQRAKQPNTLKCLTDIEPHKSEAALPDMSRSHLGKKDKTSQLQ